MLSFKEFVFASWKLRGTFNTNEEAEKSWYLWEQPAENNGWWLRYKSWVEHGSPMPVKDLSYNKLSLEEVAMHHNLPIPKSKQPVLSFEEFFIHKMNKVAPDVKWTIEHLPKETHNLSGWQKVYNEYLKEQNVTTIPVKQKPARRYLNRV
jgi:hypothetical protein